MSRSNSRAPVEKFHFPNSRKLWHDSAGATESLGCRQCVYLEQCGGLQVEASVYDCMTYCRCEDPSTCDNVCPGNLIHLVARSREVGGFDLGRVQPAPRVQLPALPLCVPLIYHRTARSRPPRVSTVALSLYQLIRKKDGGLRFASHAALLDHFQLAENTALILSGTDKDPSIERWWKLPDRERVIRELARLGISLITAPNFSLFDDVSRLDNLYNIQRIARIWSEIQRAGIACALHLNARTDRDWERWIAFLSAHPEIESVAFEFGTGAGMQLRIGWHVQQLTKLAALVTRPLHLVMRGGLTELAALRKAFARLTVIETNAFVKAQRRQRAVIRDGQLRSESAPSPPGAPIDDLLDANIDTYRTYIAGAPAAAGTAVRDQCGVESGLARETMLATNP